MDGMAEIDETHRAEVYDMAVSLLEERSGEEGLPDTEAWTTGSEIAQRLGMDKAEVLPILRSMNHTRLYVRDVGHEIEVFGVVHSAVAG
jgi:hypothetical protein